MGLKPVVNTSSVDRLPPDSSIVRTVLHDFNPASSDRNPAAVLQIPLDHAVSPAVAPKISELLDSRIFVSYIHPAE
jgi:hypothetical protein